RPRHEGATGGSSARVPWSRRSTGGRAARGTPIKGRGRVFRGDPDGVTAGRGHNRGPTMTRRVWAVPAAALFGFLLVAGSSGGLGQPPGGKGDKGGFDKGFGGPKGGFGFGGPGGHEGKLGAE